MTDEKDAEVERFNDLLVAGLGLSRSQIGEHPLHAYESQYKLEQHDLLVTTIRTLRKNMTDDEKQVFIAAFVAEWAKERAFLRAHSKDPYAVPDGFSCAEVADSCVLAFREAFNGENRGHLEAFPFVKVTNWEDVL